MVTFYLIAQMVGAGNLIRLLFGLPYEFAIVIVGLVMLAYVLFGGMIATTWVQIVKAVMLLGGATLLAVLVLARFGMNPLALFARGAGAIRRRRAEPGRLVTDPIDAMSLGLALMLGTAGLPHILMRFYTVRDARTARTSVGYATAFIGFFYLLTFILGFGAMVIIGREAITAVDAGGNMAAPLLAEALGGTPFLGFIAAVAFATILAVVAGLTLSGAATLSHDLWVNVVRGAHADEREQLSCRAVATVVLAGLSILLGITFKGQNVAYMVGLAFAIAASANFPGAGPVDLLETADDGRCAGEHVRRDRVDADADLSVADDSDRRAEDTPRRGSRSGIPASDDPALVCRRRSRSHCCVRRRPKRSDSWNSSGKCTSVSSKPCRP